MQGLGVGWRFLSVWLGPRREDVYPSLTCIAPSGADVSGHVLWQSIIARQEWDAGKRLEASSRVDPLLAWYRSASDFLSGCCYQGAIKAYREEGGRNQEKGRKMKGRRRNRGACSRLTLKPLSSIRGCRAVLSSLPVQSLLIPQVPHNTGPTASCWSISVPRKHCCSEGLSVMRVTTYLQSHTCLQSFKPHIPQEPFVSLP